MVGASSSDDKISNLDLGNPLYLQTSDFNSNTIISVKLTGTENYRVWVAAMKLAINTRNKTGFLDDLFLGQVFSNNASEVWAKLKETYDKLDGYPPGYNKNPGPKTNGPRTFNVNFVSSSSEKGASLSFTNEQMIKLMNLINEAPLEVFRPIWHFTLGWIIDFRANQHMTIFTSNMFGVIDITDLNLPVGHPNGTRAKIKYVGDLKLFNKIVLFDVLVVPEYCVSLLFVNKLYQR
ncbi:ribonuclease H-like domain-containing protein [Tanacetum coccineum]